MPRLAESKLSEYSQPATMTDLLTDYLEAKSPIPLTYSASYKGLQESDQTSNELISDCTSN